jgi:hypothetical protein
MTLDEVAARHPNLVQLAYYEGKLESWVVADPSAPPEQWLATYHATPEDVPDVDLAADLRMLLTVLDVEMDPVVWHRVDMPT